jgi:hypothetical protein
MSGGTKAPRIPAQELEDLCTSVCSGTTQLGDLDPEVLGQLIPHLKMNLDVQIRQRRTDDAEKADQYLHLARHLYDKAQRDLARKYRVTDLERRLERAKEELTELTSRLASEEAQMREDHLDSQNSLIERQQAELAHVKEQWHRPAKAQFFNRTSSHLRGLRIQAVLLFNDHRYNEMRTVEKQAEAEEAHEADECAREMNAQYVYAQQLLMAKHEREIGVLIHAQDLRRAEHDAKGKADVAVLERRIDNLKRQLEEASDPGKSWNRPRENAGGAPPVAHCGDLVGSKAFRLSLPPLQGPMSARRIAASKRHATFR